MKEVIRLAWEGLFLNEAAYAEIREHSSPVLQGLKLVLLIALAVALVGLVGTVLEWATTPNLGDIQQVVLEGIQQMPWYRELRADPEFRKMFVQQYEQGWQIFPTLFGAPNPRTAASRIIVLPVMLTVVWLLYGVVAHAFARFLGGQANLSQTLGCTALAATPELLNLVTLFPYVAVGSVVTGTWALLCRYTALKTCHRLTWGGALVAALLPYVFYALVLLSFVACLGGAAAAAVFGGGTSR